MIGEMPQVCLLCGARHDRFTAWEVAEKTYCITGSEVSEVVS